MILQNNLSFYKKKVFEIIEKYRSFQRDRLQSLINLIRANFHWFGSDHMYKIELEFKSFRSLQKIQKRGKKLNNQSYLFTDFLV